MKIKTFEIFEPLPTMVDSMLFSSYTTIAKMVCETEEGEELFLSLEVRGEVSVQFNGLVYNNPGKFPATLKSLIKNHPNHWSILTKDNTGSPVDIYVDNNNWVEYIFDYDGHSDGIICEENISALTNEELKQKMLGVCKHIAEEA